MSNIALALVLVSDAYENVLLKHVVKYDVHTFLKVEHIDNVMWPQSKSNFFRPVGDGPQCSMY